MSPRPRHGDDLGPIVEVTVQDIPELVQLEEEGFLGRERWSEASWRAELNRTNQRAVGLRVDGRLVAAALASAWTPDSELLRVIVAHSQRRRGLAATLLRECLDWATRLGATRMLLEVRDDNEGALALYRGAGFTQLSQRHNYYGPHATALVLVRTLETGDSEMLGAATREDMR